MVRFHRMPDVTDTSSIESAGATPSDSRNDGVATAAFYHSRIEAFQHTDTMAVLGKLTNASSLPIDTLQADAWKQQIDLLKRALSDIDGSVFLEFDIPRLGSRIDGVVVASAAVVPIEFKVGETRHLTADYNQAWDYALDLKNFHEGSRAAPIFPVLCATAAPGVAEEWAAPHVDGVYPPIKTNASNVADAVRAAISIAQGVKVDATKWGRSAYRPSPTIIEAAKSLYAQHSVAAIARNDAGARNLYETTGCVESSISRSQLEGQKSIIFVTGVPGAGKTLVGLNIATQHLSADDAQAVFLSGNGPLVSVLREALVEDEMKRQAASGAAKERKGVVRQKVKPFIQNVHHFRDAGLRDRIAPPVERIAIFDEAQRAWNREKTSLFMSQRKGVRNFDMSEPEFLLSYMDRHSDWSVVVCLVGGGQEIHTGEAGIGAWLDAVREKFPHWRAYISAELHDSEYAAGRSIDRLGAQGLVETNHALHLSVSMRSFRSNQVSAFVKAVLDSDQDRARELVRSVLERYPIRITRDRSRARKWVREQARGTERYGLIASSQAQRLKAYCVDVRVNVDPVKYFLAGPQDTRSSYYMEDAATEFQTQGLELDWACLCWDADLRRARGKWSHHNFRGDRWISVNKEERQQYLTNAYRVLLTRARQGMAIFVPKGRKSDPTIRPEYYDETFEYLTSLGLPEL
ncbi:MAG: DUF2075 domain-containing protein [Gemmatimonas sp.]